MRWQVRYGTKYLVPRTARQGGYELPSYPRTGSTFRDGPGCRGGGNWLDARSSPDRSFHSALLSTPLLFSPCSPTNTPGGGQSGEGVSWTGTGTGTWTWTWTGTGVPGSRGTQSPGLVHCLTPSAQLTRTRNSFTQSLSRQRCFVCLGAGESLFLRGGGYFALPCLALPCLAFRCLSVLSRACPATLRSTHP